MTRTPAPREPRHSSGGARGAGRGQWVRYPLRLVVDTAAYADADTKVYGKVKALSKGRMCEASVGRLAEFTGLSVSAVEKALTRLSRPAPTDGVTELTRRQRSHRATGKGLTNERSARRLEADERYVYAPVRAADALRGTLHRLYLLLRYTTLVEHRDLTLGEIGQALAHHSGKHAGEPLHEGTAARLLDELEGLGWITQDKRQGHRGRHQVTVHDDPVHPAHDPASVTPAPRTPPPSTPDAECGAAPDLECGAPAYKEDLGLTHLENTAAHPGGGVRRRRGDRKWAPGPVDNSAAAPDTFRAARRPRPYDGPSLSLSPRVWDVLVPVADLLPRISPFVLRQAARAIGRQLDAQIPADDLHDQLVHRRARTGAANLADPGRWLLGVALADWTSPCGLTDCVDGLMRHTGTPCKACAGLALPPGRRPARGQPPPTAAATSLQECPNCAAPYRPPLRHPNCRLCNTPLPATA
ncbi:hypothetical protein [Streptomyces sp. AK08-02]|uniref:hypothetical protein n=1 Tax=Streptomyces sp. AK08-02 TaxID=3028654 RepID=UPI0029B4B7BE|nr:hypothetical protein [Streptomyces sp. AK08-02]MDX3748705.1 hypothetical protein [Streptomyces sp. AK08-02]